MKISARTAFKGTVTAISNGPVSTEVTIKIAPKIEICIRDYDELGEAAEPQGRF